MTHKILDVGAAKQIGKYSDAIETAAGLRWLHTSGTPGVSDDGTVPEGIEAQTRLAWRYILAMLEKAGMTTADLVKVTTSLTDAKNIPAYAKVRSEMLGDVRPAFMLQVVTGLMRRHPIRENNAPTNRTDGSGGIWELAWLSRRSRLAGAEVFKENVGEHPHLARG
jgi:2-iminobutanoate/2-iminopropanoate deaminase